MKIERKNNFISEHYNTMFIAVNLIKYIVTIKKINPTLIT